MSRTRFILGTLSLMGASLVGCIGPTGITRPGWWQDWKDTAKAASGTSEYSGFSSQSREIERSLGNHRTKPVASID